MSEANIDALVNCPHTITRAREGKKGSWCIVCGGKALEVETRECGGCQHFKDMGAGQIPICKKHRMVVLKTMCVTYKTNVGSCWVGS